MTRYTSIQSLWEAGIIEKNYTPANCVLLMQREFVEYVTGESATYAYPALEIFSNHRKTMQGGFISAAFDNTFGVLVVLDMKQYEMASIDLHVNYHRPIMENDKLTVKVYFQSKGRNIVSMAGEAHNNAGMLIATATTNIMLLNPRRQEQSV